MKLISFNIDNNIFNDKIRNDLSTEVYSNYHERKN